MLDTFFHALAKEAGSISERNEGAAFLKAIRAIYPSNSVDYICLNLPAPNHCAHFINCHLTDTQAKHFVLKTRLNVENLNLFFARNVEDQLRPAPALERHLFRAAPRHEVTADTTGSLVLPLPTVHGELALFHFDPGLLPDDWQESSDALLADLECLAGYFHHHILRCSCSRNWPAHFGSRPSQRDRLAHHSQEP